MKKRPSKTLTFFLSFCPGVGHLYMGAMTRGLQFLILFFGLWAAIDIFSLRVFSFAMPVLWFYAFFDALQLADQEVILDKSLFGGKLSSSKWLGPCLIVLGALFLMENSLPVLWRRVIAEADFPWSSVRTFVLALALIIAGIILLKGRRVKND
ncbi:MAG TPA: hypothetical protein PKN71_04980 [Bacillota bacterium]|nr:hypothetical protein [Bacillota bacterium]HPZ21727.1 hypothetical protein [Bacillota bacterium]HQD19227.1 hypothetical protein [Bacillota bacterium]